MYDLSCVFDIDKHKKNFIHYLEVIITDDGVVHYAVPSHQMFIEDYLCKKLGYKTRRELADTCPRDKWLDYLDWLCEKSNCCAVWEDGVQYHSLTKAQILTLRKLKINGLYLGKVPEIKGGITNVK